MRPKIVPDDEKSRESQKKLIEAIVITTINFRLTSGELLSSNDWLAVGFISCLQLSQRSLSLIEGVCGSGMKRAGLRVKLGGGTARRGV